MRVHAEGVAPYIPIGHDQLDEVTQVLDANGIGYTVDLDAGSGGGEQVAAVNLGAGADIKSIQATLNNEVGGSENDDGD